MSELMRLIQSHLDRYGVTRATFAKRVGTTPQTVQNWKSRSTTMPRPEHLKGVAKETGIPYLIVLDAALMDAGYRDSLADDLDALEVRIARYVRDAQRGVVELQEYLSQPYFPDQGDMRQLPADATTEEVDDFIDILAADLDRLSYGNDNLLDREFLHQYINDHLRAEDDLETETKPDASSQARKGQEALADQVEDSGIPVSFRTPDDSGMGGLKRDDRRDNLGSG